MKRNLLVFRARLIDWYASYRQGSGRLGPLPQFIVIGAQKSGTTYFYQELAKHPNIAPAFIKEVRYFDINENYRKGLDWYRSFFPSELQSNGRRQESIRITGEASPCYFFHPHAPHWISEAMPDVKLILLLRNPVNRAYSHYHHEVRLGFETLAFEEAIRSEHERLLSEKEKMLVDEQYFSESYMHHAYLDWSRYVEHLPEWLRSFPQEQIQIIRSEDFFQDKHRVFRRVVKFLELPQWELKFGKPTRSRYPKISKTVKKYLSEYFEPHNRSLYEYLSVDLGWNRESNGAA